jgi:cell division septal protein FtsQ
MSVKAPAEKNYRRARAKPARRRKLRALFTWRVALGVCLAVLTTVAGYQTATLVYRSSLLRVNHVRVHGNARVSSGEVQTIVRDLQGSHILTADLARSRHELLESPWLAEVALRRVLPSTIDIYVSERRPFGLGRHGNQLYLVSRDGVVMDEFGPRYADFDLPIVDGLVPPAPRTGPRTSRANRSADGGAPRIDRARAELAARVVDAIQGTAELTRRVSQIDVTDAHDAVILLDHDPALLHVGEDRFRERLQSYLEIAEALRERVPDIDYVDLRFEQRVYVKPRGRAERTAMPLPAAGKTF